MTPRRSTVLRACAALAFVFACLPSAGCGARMFARRGGSPVPAALAANAHPKAARTGKSAKTTKAPKPEPAPVEDPRDPYWSWRSAERHVAADSLALAEAELNHALELDPAYAPALALLSRIYYDSGRHREAVTLLEPVRLQPDAYPPQARQLLLAGLALHEDALGQTERAREALAPVIDSGAKQAGSVATYVTLRGETPDAAAELAQDALHHEGKSAVNQNNAGITQLRAGDVDGARKAFTDAIARDATLPGPYYNLAILEKYYRFDDAAATRWFTEYWSRSHQDPDGLRSVFAPAATPDAPSAGGHP